MIWSKVCTTFPFGCTACCFSATTYLIFTHHSCLSGAGEILILSSNFRPRPPGNMPFHNFNKYISFVKLMIKMFKRPGPKIELSIITVVHYPEFPGKSFSIYHKYSLLHLNSENIKRWAVKASLWNPDICVGCAWKSCNVLDTLQSFKKGPNKELPCRISEHSAFRAGHTLISSPLLPTAGRAGIGLHNINGAHKGNIKRSKSAKWKNGQPSCFSFCPRFVIKIRTLMDIFINFRNHYYIFRD